MRIKGLILSLILFVAILMPTTPARAGGAHWIIEGLDRSELQIIAWGEHVRATSDLWLEGVVPGRGGDEGAFWGGPEQGPYYGYVAARSGSNLGPFPPPLPKDAMMIGQVSFTESGNPDSLDLSLDFVMPELEPGYYSLVHCNDPCTRQIGDLMSTPIVVVEDRSDAFVVGAVHEVDRDLFGLRYRVSKRVNDLQALGRALRSDVSSLEAENGTLEDRIADLEQSVLEARREATEQSWPVGVITILLLMAALVIVLLIWLLVGRRRLSFPLNQPQRGI